MSCRTSSKETREIIPIWRLYHTRRTPLLPARLHSNHFHSVPTSRFSHETLHCFQAGEGHAVDTASRATRRLYLRPLWIVRSWRALSGLPRREIPTSSRFASRTSSRNQRPRALGIKLSHLPPALFLLQCLVACLLLRCWCRGRRASKRALCDASPYIRWWLGKVRYATVVTCDNACWVCWTRR